VVGCDLHSQLPSPPLPPIGPHVVAAVMGGADPATTKASKTVKAGAGHALGRQHDLGRGLYHMAANLLLPLVCAGAGNKAEFGCTSVKIGACGAGEEELSMAAALYPGVGLNVQLDCGDPCPLPSSICIASFTSVHAGLTPADIVGGYESMRIDVVLAWIFGEVAGVLAGGVQRAVCRELGYVLALLGPDVRLLWAGLDVAAGPTMHQLAKMVIGWFVGTPLGYSYAGPVPGRHNVDWDPLGSIYGGKLNDYVNSHPVAP
jgi:hypothetical protein